MKVYQKIASCLLAMEACRKSGNEVWQQRHYETIKSICANHLPSGGGWDCGTKLDFTTSTPERLVFIGSFHHMDEAGGYDGWTDHNIVVKPSLVYVIDVMITGRNRNDVKEYLHQMFNDSLQYSLVGVAA